MNYSIFQSYIDNITQEFHVSQEYIFSDGQERKKTEPRQLFFYLCRLKGIPIVTVQKFLKEIDFPMHHSTIIQGIKKVEDNIDDDYSQLIDKLCQI